MHTHIMLHAADGTETEVAVDIAVSYSPGRPGREQGPDPYPSEPAEMEIDRITTMVGPVQAVLPIGAVRRYMTADAWAQLDVELWEDCMRLRNRF